MTKNYKYYVIYKITNLQTGRIYIGMHRTNNLDDNYMGSSKLLKQSIKKRGIENFKKEILHIFNNIDDMVKKEAELVNSEFVARKDTYNQHLGGKGSWYHLYNTVCVKDKHNRIFRVNNKDERYLSGELKDVNKGYVMTKDKNGIVFRVSINDERYKTGVLKHVAKNRITVKDKDNNTFSVLKDDPRYLSGEFVVFFKGKKHSEDSKERMKISNKEKQNGEKNSQFGTIWIHNDSIKENKKIKKQDILQEGWLIGRKFYK